MNDIELGRSFKTLSLIPPIKKKTIRFIVTMSAYLRGLKTKNREPSKVIWGTITIYTIVIRETITYYRTCDQIIILLLLLQKCAHP